MHEGRRKRRLALLTRLAATVARATVVLPDARALAQERPRLGGQCTSDASCSDGRGCNGVERCAEGSCRRGAPPPCDGGVACTEEDCREPGVCVSIPDSSYCDHGETCTGQGPTGCR